MTCHQCHCLKWMFKMWLSIFQSYVDTKKAVGVDGISTKFI